MPIPQNGQTHSNNSSAKLALKRLFIAQICRPFLPSYLAKKETKTKYREKIGGKLSMLALNGKQRKDFAIN